MFKIGDLVKLYCTQGVSVHFTERLQKEAGLGIIIKIYDHAAIKITGGGLDYKRCDCFVYWSGSKLLKVSSFTMDEHFSNLILASS